MNGRAAAPARPSLARRCLAEALGTGLLVGLGIGAIVAGDRVGGTSFVVLAIAWFLAVTVAIGSAVDRSGAHLNPAVTAALSIGGRFPRREVLPYLVAQLTGALVGSVAVLALLGPGDRLGATVPSTDDLVRPFAGELVFTFLLVLVVFQMPSDLRGRRWWIAAPGAVVAIATFLIGPVSGSSLNPARTIAPALLTGAFTDLWVYLTAVPLGAIAAVPVALGLARWRARTAGVDPSETRRVGVR